MRTIRIAGVQATSVNGRGRDNLERATGHVAAAADRGAELILCPEFLAAGYIYEESIWDAAELRGGMTETWLRDMALTSKAYVGASYLEADGDDFFNTFTLVKPDGTVAGRVRKVSLPGCEGWFFKSCSGRKVIDTELGRIGVGICNDNMMASFMRTMHRERVDLMLMPHSAPMVRELPPISRLMHDGLVHLAPFYARQLGVPAVMVNKVSVRGSKTRLPPLPWLKLTFEFVGPSTIADADGKVLDRLDDREGIVVADVVLDPKRRRSAPPATGVYWSRDMAHGAKPVEWLWRGLARLGARAYGLNDRRKTAARAIEREIVTASDGKHVNTAARA